MVLMHDVPVTDESLRHSLSAQIFILIKIVLSMLPLHDEIDIHR